MLVIDTDKKEKKMTANRLQLKKLEIKSFVTVLRKENRKRLVGGSETLEDTSCIAGDPSDPRPCINLSTICNFDKGH